MTEYELHADSSSVRKSLEYELKYDITDIL